MPALQTLVLEGALHIWLGLQGWALVCVRQGLGASGTAHGLDFRNQNLLELSTVTVRSFPSSSRENKTTKAATQQLLPRTFSASGSAACGFSL